MRHNTATRIRSANAALTEFNKTLATQLIDYQPIYEAVVNRQEVVGAHLAADSRLPSQSVWTCAWRSLHFRATLFRSGVADRDTG